MERIEGTRETYARGRAAALTALVVQLLLGVGMAAAAAWTRSEAFAVAAWHMVGGLPIWAVLALVYGQREAERRETLAVEKVTADGVASAVLFGERDDELERTRRRLATLTNVGLPAVSLAVGGYLVVMGGLTLWRILQRGDQPVAGHPVGLLFASAGMAFVAFGTGRWISGCAQVPAWRLLRGGASYMMSCFLVASLLGLAAAVAALADDTRGFWWVAVAIPAVMIAVGGETLSACLLDAYRPRRPGEEPRPAFDSRLLGLLTAPRSLGEVIGELIRYQFGVEVSGNWLYRLLGRSMTPLAILAGAVLLALSCLVVVGPDEEGVVLRWGAVRGAARPAGIHVKWPWPVETAVTHPTQKVLQLSVSSSVNARRADDEAILWTTGDDRLGRIGAEYYPVVLDASSGVGGLGVVDAEVVVQYRVRDILQFLESAPDAEATLAAATQQEVGRYFASHDLEFLLSRGRTAAGGELAAAVQSRVESLRLGLGIVDVSITALQPPGGNVARAFHRQIAARQDRETLIEKARRTAVATLTQVAGSVALGRRLDAAILELEAARAAKDAADADNAGRQFAGRQAEIDDLLGEARGEAAELIHAARGDRWTRAVGEQAARERFAGELLAHDQAPRYYQAARFFAVLADGLAERRKFVVAGNEDELPVLRMDFADPASAIETLLGD